MITVNKIYKDLIAMIKTALTTYKLNWQVIQAYQQTMGNLKPPFIMLHRLTATNLGFQFGKDYTEDNQAKHSENQYEILTFQIDAYRPRAEKDNENTITGADVARLLARWFMSDTGIKEIRSKGYDVLRITEVVEEYYKAVSDIYQVNPHFQMQLVTLQTDVTEAQKIEGVIGNVKEIEQLKNEGGQ